MGSPGTLPEPPRGSSLWAGEKALPLPAESRDPTPPWPAAPRSPPRTSKRHPPALSKGSALPQAALHGGQRSAPPARCPAEHHALPLLKVGSKLSPERPACALSFSFSPASPFLPSEERRVNTARAARETTGNISGLSLKNFPFLRELRMEGRVGEGGGMMGAGRGGRHREMSTRNS